MEARALIFVSAADVATIAYRLVAQALLNGIVENMIGKLVGVVTIVAAALLLLVVNMTSPTSAGPVGILAVFFLLYILLTSLLTVVFIAVNRIVVKISSSVKTRTPAQAMTVRRAYYFASVLAMAPIMIVGIGSVGKVGITEFVLVSLFMLIGLFYVEKRSRA